MPNPRRDPVRTCVACREEAGKGALVRVVRRTDGTAAVDPSGGAPGRGAYVHSAGACVELARRRRALERALKTPIGPEIWAELLSPGG